MTVSIVACGESASEWYKMPCDVSIGVNDSWKWGHKTDYLLIFNKISRFTRERMDVIRSSKPVKFYTHTPQWQGIFPEANIVKLRQWDGHLRDDVYASAQTSPFIAMDFARKLGAKDIILWGVDFNTHKIFNQSNPQTKQELRSYKGLIEALLGVGVSVWLGKEGSGLDLPIWRH